MKKIILKCKLKNHDDFEKKLADIDMDFGPVYWQYDRVFVPRGFKRGGNFPRLIMRTEMKAIDRPPRYEMILKRHVEDSGVDIVDNTVVRDYSEATKIIQQLGFKMEAEVSRRRQEITMDAGTKLYLDKVENVPGYYAKMEAVLEEDDKVSEVREEMMRTLKTLGQDKKNVSEESYQELLAD